jgi:hypothetical protein
LFDAPGADQLKVILEPFKIGVFNLGADAANTTEKFKRNKQSKKSCHFLIVIDFMFYLIKPPFIKKLNKRTKERSAFAIKNLV